MTTLKAKRLAGVGVGILAIATLASFWLFSRFTVDDAFISWRYGQNLVQHGIWNYNPSLLDPTQAYTNPIFAMLSILPAFFGWDTVLFFKLISLLTVLAFAYWFIKKTNGSWAWLLLFLALPPVMIHAFSGLETFLWAFLYAALAIHLYENRLGFSIATSIALFLTRPEAWTLVVIVPLYFLLSDNQKISFKKLNFKAALLAAGVLGTFMAAYFVFHLVVFGELLPNTFFVKSGHSFSIRNLVFFAFFLLPIFWIFLAGKRKLALALALGFVPIVLNQSMSSLIVNYQSRYAFHVFAPLFLITVILLRKGVFEKLRWQTTASALVGLVVFQLTCIPGTIDLVTSNPRLQKAHIALGETLKGLNDQGKIRNFAFGDAGATAFYSGLSDLDNIQLGSRLSTKYGLTDQLFRDYQVDVTVLHATTSGIRYDEFNLKRVEEWSQANGLTKVCDVYFRPNYLLTIYAREEFSELESLCAQSEVANNRSELEVLKETAILPPWQYWR